MLLKNDGHPAARWRQIHRRDRRKRPLGAISWAVVVQPSHRITWFRPWTVSAHEPGHRRRWSMLRDALSTAPCLPPDADTLSTADGQARLAASKSSTTLIFPVNRHSTQVNERPFSLAGLAIVRAERRPRSAFTLRLSGFFTPKESGKHTFGLGTVGRGRLFIDGKEVIDNWDCACPLRTENSRRSEMTAGHKATPSRWNTVGTATRAGAHLSVSHMPPHAADLTGRGPGVGQTRRMWWYSSPG